MRVDDFINAMPIETTTTHRAYKPAPTVPSEKSQALDSIGLPRAADVSAVQFAIEVDSGSKEIVVKMIDPTTGEVIRQIPSEAILSMARAINALMAAQHIDSKS
jgi:flagellar protein FlaG